jgi:hypothetical protein
MNKHYEPEEIRSLTSEELDKVSGGATPGHITAGIAVGDQYFLIIATATDHSVHNIYWG